MKAIKWYTNGESIPDDAIPLSGRRAKTVYTEQTEGGDGWNYHKEEIQYYFPFLVGTMEKENVPEDE